MAAMKNDFVQVYLGLYNDGAAIKTEYSVDEHDICLTLARNHDTPDDVFIFTRAQANEVIYALSKALLAQDDPNKDPYED